VLDVQARQKNHFSEEDVRIQETLAAQIAVSWYNAQLYTETQRRAEREAMINTISQKIQSAVTVEAALQTAVSELGRALKARQAQVRVQPSAGDGRGNGAAGEGNGRS
jgi:GAF domain-containing protein